MCADSKVFVRVSKIITHSITIMMSGKLKKKYAYTYALVYVYVPVHKMFFDY